MPLIILVAVLALIFNTSIYSMSTIVFGAFLSLWAIRAILIVIVLVLISIYVKRRL